MESRVAGAAGRESAASLVERDAEVGLLADLAAEAVLGNGGTVIVEAGVGMGKTSLLNAGGETAADAGARVLSALGGELEGDIAFGIVRQLLEVALADPELEPGPGGEHRLYWRVAELAERRPLALFVDDAHWADQASLRWLSYLARRVEGLPLLLVIAARPAVGEVARMLDAIRTLPATARIDLAPLSADGAAHLVAERLGTEPASALGEACREASAGNPFLIAELAAALARESGGGAIAPEGVREIAPSGVIRAFDSRLAALGEAPRALAGALAVLGDGATLPTLAAVAGLSREEAISAYDDLAAAGIAADSRQLGFVHPVARTALYEALGPAERWRGHERAAASLRKSGADGDVIAHHLLRSQPTGDPAAAALLAAAGERVIGRGGLAEGIDLLERALVEPPARAERPAAVLALAEALVASSRHEAAISLLESSPEVERDSIRGPLARGRALAGVGDGTGAVAALEAAADERGGDQALRLRIEATTLGMYVAEYAETGQRRAAEFVALSGETATERLALATGALSIGYGVDGEADAAVAVAGRALAGEQTLADGSSDRVATLFAIHVLILAEKLEAAAEAVDRHLESGRKLGVPSAFLAAVLGRLMIARAAGDVDRVLAEGELAWVDAELPEDDPVVLRLSAYTGGTLLEGLAQRGELERARELIATAERSGLFGRPELAWLHFGRGLVRLVCGEAQGALDDFLAVGEAAGFGRYEFRNPAWRLGAARALALDGDTVAALEMVDRELEIARRWGAPGGIGVALRHRALIAGEDAPAGLSEAAELLRASPRRLDLAEALIDLGKAERREGHRIAARESLAAGMDLASSCGALGIAEEARQDLVLLGERPRRHRISGVGALTPTERRIAELAAAGSSNREIAQELFVTLKTVEGHLSNAYRKLGIRSRTELALKLAAD